MTKGRVLTFGELTEELLDIYTENGEIADDEWAAYYVYTDRIECSSECYIGGMAEVSEDDEEIFPEYAVKNGMDAYISGEMIADVVSAYLYRSGTATVQQLTDALNYYLENDCFMENDSGESGHNVPKAVIRKEITDKRILMKIKKAFSSDMPLGEFIERSREVPFVLTDRLTVAEIKAIIKSSKLEGYVSIEQ